MGGPGLLGPRKIDNCDTAFMPVHVEQVERTPLGPVYSVAHYYEQNGDQCCDPDCCFLVAESGVHPISFEQAGLLYQRAVTFDDGTLKVNQRQQAEITDFCNQWMVNIAEQQSL